MKGFLFDLSFFFQTAGYYKSLIAIFGNNFLCLFASLNTDLYLFFESSNKFKVFYSFFGQFLSSHLNIFLPCMFLKHELN